MRDGLGTSSIIWNYLGVEVGMALKFYTIVAKRLKLKVRRLLGLILMFVEVTGENWKVGEVLTQPRPPPPFS